MGTRSLLAVAALVLVARSALADVTKTIDADKGLKAVKDQITQYKADYGQVAQVKDTAVAKVFPRHLFFTVMYRQYPVAREVPAPLKFANIFACSAEGKLTLLNESKEMKAFFADNVGVIFLSDMDAAQAAVKDTIRAWLKLSPELQQDGFYKFTILEDSIKAEDLSDKFTILVASGKVVVMQGGNGEINVRISYLDKNQGRKGSKLETIRIEETSKIKPGPRPICQATKLLDADPIVRKMAEQDLLIMGPAAKGYLDEQRAKASPELQKAIDRLWQRIVKEDR